MFMQSTLELKAEGVERFTVAMKRVVEIVEGEGWRLMTAFQQVSGRLHTAVDMWEIDDLNHYSRGLGALRAAADFAEIGAVLAATVERETVVFGVRAAWVPDGR